MNYWLFGLSAAGKTTIGDALAAELCTNWVAGDPDIVRLDGDILRGGVSSDLGFSDADRKENLERAITIASWETFKGNTVIATFITPFEAIRQRVIRRVLDIKLVFIDCGLEVCIERDPKGLYRRYRDGLITQMSGLDAPFEESHGHDVYIDTTVLSVDEAVQTILGS